MGGMVAQEIQFHADFVPRALAFLAR